MKVSGNPRCVKVIFEQLLSLNGELRLVKPSNRSTSLTATTSAIQWDFQNGASPEQCVIDLNGHSIIVPSSSGSSQGGCNIAGTVNFNSPGSSIHSAYTHHLQMYIFHKLNVTADGGVGRRNTSESSGWADITFRTTAELNVTGAEFAFDLNGPRKLNRYMNIYNEGLIKFDKDSKIIAKWTGSGSMKGDVNFYNRSAGTVVQAGELANRVFINTLDMASTNLVRNGGIWILEGETPTIKRLTTVSKADQIVVPIYTNLVTGRLTGSSASDALEFNEEVADGTRRMPLDNAGTIAPGAGSSGEGLESVGLLTLRDIDLNVWEGGVIALDIGGAKETEMDRLVLAKGLTDPADEVGLLSLNEGSTLQLLTVNDHDHRASFRQPVIKAGAVTGEFTTVKLDGETFTDNELELANGTSYKVVYEADAVWLYCFGIDNQTTILIY